MSSRPVTVEHAVRPTGGEERTPPIVRFAVEETPTTAIVNPMASGGGAAERWPPMHETLRRRFPRLRVVHTEGAGHASSLCADALVSGSELVLAVGGDGTAHEVLQGFLDEHGRNRFPTATLGILHAGTGGDFQRMFGERRRRRHEHAVERLLAAKPRLIDYGVARYVDDQGHARQRGFLNVASVGLSPEVVRELDKTDKRLGPMAYVVGALQGIRRYRNQQVLIGADEGARRRVDLTLACVANGQYFGGGMWVCPHSAVDDGAFDLLTLTGMPRLHLISTLARVFRGRHLRSKGVETARARRVEFEPVWRENHVLVELDGEQVGRLPASFEVMASALRVRLG